MEITLLGAGTAVPTPGRSPAAVLWESPGLTALLDMGPGAVHKAAAQGVDPLRLQYLFLTHLHSDHTLDLVTFLQMNDSTPGVERLSPVYLTGCRGTGALYERLMLAYPGIAPRTYELHIREVAEDRFELNGVRVSTTLSDHTRESVCYRFDAPEGSLVYTGDCVPRAALEEFCRDADILICECSFPAGWHSEDHMNADTVGQLAANAGVKQLVVTHPYPPAVQADLAGQIRRRYAGPVSVALDGFKLRLGEKR